VKEKKRKRNFTQKNQHYAEGGNQFIFVYYSYSGFYMLQGLPVYQLQMQVSEEKQGTVRSTAGFSATSLMGKTWHLSLFSLYLFFLPLTLFLLFVSQLFFSIFSLVLQLFSVFALSFFFFTHYYCRA
jgi:hypothetical protein